MTDDWSQISHTKEISEWLTFYLKILHFVGGLARQNPHGPEGDNLFEWRTSITRRWVTIFLGRTDFQSLTLEDGTHWLLLWVK